MSDCPMCNGLGYIMGMPCVGCGGDGKSKFVQYTLDRMTYLNEEQEEWRVHFIKDNKELLD